MEKNGQLNVRIGPAHRRKLEALAAGHGVTVGKAVALLLDTVPVEPISRTVSGLGLVKNSAQKRNRNSQIVAVSGEIL